MSRLPIPVLVLTLLVVLPSSLAAQAVKGTLARKHQRLGRPRAPRRHRDDHRGQHQHQLLTRRPTRAGYYIFSNLKDGTYRVVAELTGFKKTVRDGIDRAGQRDACAST